MIPNGFSVTDACIMIAVRIYTDIMLMGKIRSGSHLIRREIS